MAAVAEATVMVQLTHHSAVDVGKQEVAPSSPTTLCLDFRWNMLATWGGGGAFS